MKRNFLGRTRASDEDQNHLHNLTAGSTKKQKTLYATQRYTIYVGDDNEMGSPNGVCYAVCANIRGISQTEQDKQVCAHVIGIMIGIVPEWRQPLLDLLKEHRFCIHVVSLPSQAEIAMLDFDKLPIYDFQSSWTLFGFCLLLLFKNCTQGNYNSYAHARFKALRAVNGVLPDEKIPNPFSLKKSSGSQGHIGSHSCA